MESSRRSNRHKGFYNFIMAMTCKKCGTPATEDQAFCSKCGAVIGMEGAPPKQDRSPNFAATMVGKAYTPPPPPKPETPPAPTERAGSAARAPEPARHPVSPPPPVSGGSNTTLLVIIGFVVVLLIGGVLLLLLYFMLSGN